MGGARRAVSSRAASAPRDDVSGARGRRAGLRARAALVPPAQRLAPRRSAPRHEGAAGAVLRGVAGAGRGVPAAAGEAGPGAAHRAACGGPEPRGRRREAGTERGGFGRAASFRGPPAPFPAVRRRTRRNGGVRSRPGVPLRAVLLAAAGWWCCGGGGVRSPRSVPLPSRCSARAPQPLSPAESRGAPHILVAPAAPSNAAGWRPGSKRERGAPEPQRAQLRAPAVIPAVSSPASRALRSVSLDIRMAGSGRGLLPSLAAERVFAWPSVCGTPALGCAPGERFGQRPEAAPGCGASRVRVLL